MTGGKGGVGKSTFARGLLDILRAAELNVAAFDGDPTNAQLFRYYDGVQRIELDTQGEADALLNDMDAGKADVFLVDVAAGGSQTLLDLENDIGLISEAMDMGYRFTVVSVKNLYFGEGDRFRLFDDSKTEARLLERGGKVVEMPDLFDDTYELLDKLNLPFRSMLTDESFPRAQRSRINRWLKDFEREVRKADGVLAL